MNDRVRFVPALVVLGVIGVSCSGNGETSSTVRPFDPNPNDAVRLYSAFDDCDGVVEWTKAEMLERVTPYGLDMYPVYWGRDGGWMEDAPAATEAPAADESTGGDANGSGTSGTNTQEAGVDEGDITETDGRFVYSIIDNRLRSVDLDTTTVLADLEVPQGESQMVLADDVLVVATNSWSQSASTVVTRYSIDSGVPEFRRRDHLEGSMVSMRVVDGVVQLVLHAGITNRLDFVSPRDGTTDAQEAAKERNIEVIEALEAEDLLPRSFEESALGAWGTPTVAIDCARMGHPGDFSGWGITWVATVDTETLGAGNTETLGAGTTSAPFGAAGLITQAGSTYTSEQSLYVTTNRWNDFVDEEWVSNNPESPRTVVHRFSLLDGVEYVASGEVLGTLLNSYSMSEFEGDLRVATTAYSDDFGGGQDNGVHVLRVDGTQLVEVGSVRGLGRGEQIQGVRFDGPRGYVVTFRQVDPLYVIDLSDPTNPEMVGELKIPGYSTYLKPIAGDRLIGVGMSGTDTGQITGVQVSLFDVSDPAAPRQVATAEIAEWSEATWDPHAFLWWEPTGQIVIPKEMNCVEFGGPGCESAVVLRLVGDELVEQGRLMQWFPIRRSMIASNRLVTVGAGGVLVSNLETLAELADIRFDIPGTTLEDDLP